MRSIFCIIWLLDWIILWDCFYYEFDFYVIDLCEINLYVVVIFMWDRFYWSRFYMRTIFMQNRFEMNMILCGINVLYDSLLCGLVLWDCFNFGLHVCVVFYVGLIYVRIICIWYWLIFMWDRFYTRSILYEIGFMGSIVMQNRFYMDLILWDKFDFYVGFLCWVDFMWDHFSRIDFMWKILILWV